MEQEQQIPLAGSFLDRVVRVSYHWHPQKPFFALQFAVIANRVQKLSGRLYCTAKALWKLNWFLRDFGYDRDLLGQDQVDEKALLNLRGIVLHRGQWPALSESPSVCPGRKVGHAVLRILRAERRAGFRR